MTPTKTSRTPAQLAMHTMTGFIDWWHNRVRGEWISNESYDRIYDRFLDEFKKLS